MSPKIYSRNTLKVYWKHIKKSRAHSPPTWYPATLNSLHLVQVRRGGLLAQRQGDLKEMPQAALFFTLCLAKKTVCVGLLKRMKFRLLITELAWKSCTLTGIFLGNCVSNFIKYKICSEKLNVCFSRCLVIIKKEVFFLSQELIHKNWSYPAEQGVSSCVWKSYLMYDVVHRETKADLVEMCVWREKNAEWKRERKDPFVFPFHKTQEPKFWWFILSCRRLRFNSLIFVVRTWLSCFDVERKYSICSKRLFSWRFRSRRFVQKQDNTNYQTDCQMQISCFAAHPTVGASRPFH